MAAIKRLRLIRVFAGFALGLVVLLGVLVILTFVIHIDEVIEAHGYVASETSYSVRAPSDGYIGAVTVGDGTAVKRGDALATLLNESLTHQINETSLSLQQLERRRDETSRSLEFLAKAAQPTEIDKTLMSANKTRLALQAATAEKESQENEANRSSYLLGQGLVSQRQTEYAQLQAHLSAVKEAQEKQVLSEVERDLVAIRERHIEDILKVKQQLAQTDIDIAKARLELEALQKKQSLSSIVAPADGILLLGQEREKLVGQFIRTGDRLGDLIDGQSLVFTVAVSETEVRKLHEGQTVNIELNALPYQKFKVFKGRVRRVSQDADHEKTTGAATYQVKVALDESWIDIAEGDQNTRYALKPGFSGVARIIVRPDMMFISWLRKQLFGNDT